MKLQIEVAGLHCDHCVASVAEAIRNVTSAEVLRVGVGDVEVSLEDSPATRARLFDAIRSAGSFEIVGFKSTS